MAATLVESAFAKVNLTLQVIGRRADGYHELDSLVAFADLADELQFIPDEPLGLTVRGPTAAAAGGGDGNLVLKAAQALAARIAPLKVGHFTLIKQLPVAAGLGGGSADAAAALRLLARTNGLAIDDPRLAAAAQATGADVPVCLDPRPRRMTGIGEILSAPIELPRLPVVLVNPGVAVPTKQVFAAIASRLATAKPKAAAIIPPSGDYNSVLAAIAASGNDLEPAAITLQPVIADVLSALSGLPGCDLARMSGSGATCFGLFETSQTAASAAHALRQNIRTGGCGTACSQAER